MSAPKVLLLAVLGAIAAGVASMTPELKRYMKIRSMDP
jgi:hypothetical protein